MPHSDGGKLVVAKEGIQSPVQGGRGETGRRQEGLSPYVWLRSDWYLLL